MDFLTFSSEMAWPLVGSLDRLPHLLIGNGQSPLIVDEGLDLGPVSLWHLLLLSCPELAHPDEDLCPV